MRKILEGNLIVEMVPEIREILFKKVHKAKVVIQENFTGNFLVDKLQWLTDALTNFLIPAKLCFSPKFP